MRTRDERMVWIGSNFSVTTVIVIKWTESRLLEKSKKKKKKNRGKEDRKEDVGKWRMRRKEEWKAWGKKE